LIPFLLEGVALKPELNQADGIHPNAQGTIVISNILKKSIIDFIKQN
jgi:acyl-CoA thioesterase-1